MMYVPFLSFLCLYACYSVANFNEDSVNDWELLERLAFRYGTDKSKDDHNYVTTYANIFHGRTNLIRNVTEIGVSVGQSIQMWHEYFPNAIIHGVDIQYLVDVVENLLKLPRVVLMQCDSTSESMTNELGIEVESMDVIIDDGGMHERDKQELTLRNFWKFLKPGGFYIIEDIDAQSGGLDYQERPELLHPFTNEVLLNNHVSFIDSAVGHRAWEEWKRRSGEYWVVNRRVHNSYMMVIRKRVGPVPDIKINFGEVAMKPEKIIHVVVP